MSTETNYPSSSPEVWGGIECTINRVGDLFRDQLAETGHYTREADIERIAELGIKKLRYPILWEKHLPDKDGQTDWKWAEKRLANLRRRGVTPIVGLVHHGSGPAQTNLLDDAFPSLLADYAGRVATQFPWIEYYTPVNEPLTTARFSGLYGFWYPHLLDERSFIMMELNQIKGIILSMKEIRKINPRAKLVQTEDLCKIHSTPLLSYQAAFENERRWLTYDLLCGKFTAHHPLWQYFVSLGVPLLSLQFFIENTCPPDVMGFNYYVTSERFLDENLACYPAAVQGGNGMHRYTDTDAARVGRCQGLNHLMREAWERYHLPMALTECHLHCTREEQMRWMKECWEACCNLHRQGIPLIAFTAWSLLGSADWDSLLLKQKGHYESGIFDSSKGQLRPTILAKMVQSYASGEIFVHPLLTGQGWWQDPVITEPRSPNVAALLLIDDDSTALSCFERICHDRRVMYQKETLHGLQHWENILQDRHLNKELPWGIIVMFNGLNSANVYLYEMLIRYCSNNNIRCMLYGINSMVGDEILSSLDTSNYFLPIVSKAGNVGKANHAMDLFIDGETGIWIMDENGAAKMVAREPVLFE